MTYNVDSTSSKLMKLAEKFFVLYDRQLGLMTRLHYMKFMLNPNMRPVYLPGGDKQFEQGWKNLLRKFPALDVKPNHSSLQPFLQLQKEIYPSLSTFYYDFVDLMDFRVQLADILTAFASEGVHLDINLNTDITRLFLELVSNYPAMMLLQTRIPDVKAILALFNYIYEQNNLNPEPNFRRLSEFLVSETSPEGVMRACHADINPYAKLISEALASLESVFVHRTLRAKNWTDGNFLNLLADPMSVASPILGGHLAVQLIPGEALERWILFGYLLIYPELNDDVAFNRFKALLRNSQHVALFREESIPLHQLALSFLDLCGWSNRKRIAEIKDAAQAASSQSVNLHSDRRNYLRLNLRQMALVLADEPGLLGPKAFWLFWALSYSSDEINWLLRHYAAVTAQLASMKKQQPPGQQASRFEEIVGHSVGELLFYMDELRCLVTKHQPVIQRYYLQFLVSYDAPGLSDLLRSSDLLKFLSVREVEIFNGVLSQIQAWSSDEAITSTTGLKSDGSVVSGQNQSVTGLDFSSIRLDWLRLQTFLSADSSPVKLRESKRLIEHMHSMIFHTKLCDYLDELLRQTADMSAFFFHQQQLIEMAKDCRTYPAQMRFSIVFASMCQQFTNACHVMCPEERSIIGQQAVAMSMQLLRDLADQVCQFVMIRIDECGALADQLASFQAVSLLAEDKATKKKKKKPVPVKQTKNSMGNLPVVLNQERTRDLPGKESVRRLREEQTAYDKTLYGLTQLCATINHHKEMHVYDRIINPRECVQNELQLRLIDILAKYTLLVQIVNSDRDQIITKPSDLWRRLRALSDVLVGLERYFSIDLVTLYSVVFNQHTMRRDVFYLELTMTSHYTQWYCEVFLWHAQVDHFVFSPTQKSFITMATPDLVRFRAEDYADFNEFCSLAEIIGPVGMRFLCDQLMGDVQKRFEELKKLVGLNRQTLEALRDSILDNPAKAKQLATNLQKVDQFNQLLKEIGVTLALRRLALEATHAVCRKRIPFLIQTVGGLREAVASRSNGVLVPPASDDLQYVMDLLNMELNLNNLAGSLGFQCHLDFRFCSMIDAQQAQKVQENINLGEVEFRIACLMITFIAFAMPRLVKGEQGMYRIDLDACATNVHCVPYAVNMLLISLVSMLRPGGCEARYMELLATASSNLLRMGLEQSNLGTGGEDASSGANSKDHHPEDELNQQWSQQIRDSIYLIFHELMNEAPFVQANVQEVFFPYSLVRVAYHNLAKFSKTPLVMVTAKEQIAIRSNAP